MSYTKDMRRDRIKKTITYLSLLFWLSLLVACGQQEETTDDGVTYFHHSIADRNTQETQENSTETEKSEEFLLTAVDQIQESLQLYRYADGMEYRYYYGTGTRFYDKYGNRTPVTSFEPGLLVTIGDVDSEGILTEARISDQAWVYDNITRFYPVDEGKVHAVRTFIEHQRLRTFPLDLVSGVTQDDDRNDKPLCNLQRQVHHRAAVGINQNGHVCSSITH